MQNDPLKKLLKPYVLSNCELKEVFKQFCSEIRKGLSSKHHDESDIKCYVTYVQDLPTGEEVGKYLALDLGGSKFRVLLVTLKGNQEDVVESKIFTLSKEIITGPGVELFDYIAECLASFVEEYNVAGEELPLGFTFSFPCVQLGLTEALLVRWTKGFSSPGVVNENVGRLLKEAIERRGDVPIRLIAILNDTTGTVMSCAHRNPECRIGVIVGTGCNACFVEKVENVCLLEPEYKVDKSIVLINAEWGAFGDSGLLDFIRTDIDRAIDRDTLNVGTQLFEKMLAGMYLGNIVRQILIKALEQELIFAKVQNRCDVIAKLCDNPEIIEASMVSDMDADNNNNTKTQSIIKDVLGIPYASPEDCQKLRYICEVISVRSANLVGVAISGLVNRVNLPKVVVGIDGSVYRLHKKYDSYLRAVMKKFVKPDIEFDLMLSEDGSGRGAALVAAAASNNEKDEENGEGNDEEIEEKDEENNEEKAEE